MDPADLDLDAAGLMRLQKLLARSGVASRRHCEELMLAGEVEVDGEVVTRLGTKVDPLVAVVRVQGRRLPPPTEHVYLVLNKPTGVVSTMSDPQGRRTLADLVEGRPERLFHVGRLDTDTSGVLLLTNDGAFAQRMAHPSFEVDKTYVAEVEGDVGPAVLKRLADGVDLDDGPVHPRDVKLVQRGGRPLDRRADAARGPQPDRAPAAGRGGASRTPIDPHPLRRRHPDRSRVRPDARADAGRARCAAGLRGAPTAPAR